LKDPFNIGKKLESLEWWKIS